jgi:hypothetical protein
MLAKLAQIEEESGEGFQVGRSSLFDRLDEFPGEKTP